MQRLWQIGRSFLERRFSYFENRRLGRMAFSHLQASFQGPARRAVHPDALRLLILNHFYDQDIDAFLQARHDCAIWILQHSDVVGIRAFFQPEPGLAVDYNGRWMQPRVRRARRLFVGAAVKYLRQRARPDVVLCPSDVFFWFRPFIEEFRARGVPVVVQDKEGTLTPGPLTEESLALTVRHYPPLANRYYFWGPIQHDAWTKAGLEPGRIRVLGQPRSDFFFHPDRHASPEQLGFPAGKRLVTCFTFEGDVYLTADLRGRNLGRPWLRMRQELHAALQQLAADRPDIHVVVKCHPQSLELDEIHRELAGAPPNLSILHGAATAANLIVNSAVVIGFQTTALIEAMLTQVPILYCAWAVEHDRHLDWLIPLAGSGGCFQVRSATELSDLTGRLLDGAADVPAAMLARRAAFAARYFKDTRGGVADRILADLAEQVARRTLPPGVPAVLGSRRAA
jgi:hypothetical protein